MLNNKSIHFFLLLALCIPVAIACVDIMALSVSLDEIMQQFSTSIAESQWLISAYTIGTASFLILVGKLADLYGRKRLLLFGIMLFGIASLIAAASSGIVTLILARFLQGVASSVMMTTVISIIVHQFTGHERTYVLAKWTLSLGVGMSLGPLIGAAVLHFENWRFIFLINVPICLLAYYLVIKYITESKDMTSRIKIRWGEAFLLSLALVLFVSIFSSGQTLGNKGSNIIYQLISAFLLVFFCYATLLYYRGSMFIDLSLFKLKNYFEGAFCGFLSYFCMYSWLFVFAFYLQKDCGKTPLETGMMFISFSVSSTICSHFISGVIKKWGRKIPIQFGFGIVIIAFLGMSSITSHTPSWKLVLLSTMPGIMLTFVNVPSMNLAMSAVPPEKTGISSGIVFTIRWFGGSLGVAIISLLLEIGIHNKLLPPISIACLGMAFFATLGLIFATMIRTK